MFAAVNRTRQLEGPRHPACVLVTNLYVVAFLGYVVWSVLPQPTITSRSGGATAGYGAETRGGEAGSTVAVTTLDDAGPGSLRAALAGGDRTIVFRVAGTIALKSPLALQHPHVTIAGESAPKPGITVTQKPFVIADTHDVIVRHLRFRESDDDNVRIAGDCRNIVIDHCSSTRAGDGALDITEDYKTQKAPRDVTIAWCLLAGTDKAMLLSAASRASLHHNLFTHNGQRNPQVHAVREFDFRNNIVRQWSVYGMRVRAGASGNVVGNVFGPSSKRSKQPSLAFVIAEPDAGQPDTACRVFARGNLGPAGFAPDAQSTAKAPPGGEKLEFTPAGQAEAAILREVGAQPTDELDRAYITGTADPTPRATTSK
jgi:pectate lyase